jgi:16S rRNA (cytosine967-C5)-methyltransferase
MKDELRQMAARIIGRSTSVPADAALRSELKVARLSPHDSTTVANLVFFYFRWRGWLNAGENLNLQFDRAWDLEQRFAESPASFPTDELRKAVPAWAGDEIIISRDWLVSLQTPPPLWLRSKHGTREQLANKLGDCLGGPAPATDSLEYRGSMDLFRSPQFHAGEFEVQDIASQFVGVLCDPRPGETWWDACAGEGGKLLHLSELMQNKGLIWATDRSQRRLTNLRRRAARARAFNYRVASWDGAPKLPTKTKFDGILIDAPCSGVGTWQRNPHARWTTTMEDVRELGAIQQSLIVNASAGVKPGGKLIYAVCTLTKTETDAVAGLCSQRLPEFEPFCLPALPNEPPATSDRKWIWPQTYRGNGMFVAAWRRIS